MFSQSRDNKGLLSTTIGQELFQALENQWKQGNVPILSLNSYIQKKREGKHRVNLKWLFLDMGLNFTLFCRQHSFFPPIFFPLPRNLTFLSFFLYVHESLSFFFSFPIPFTLISFFSPSFYLFPLSPLLPLCNVLLGFNVSAWPTGPPESPC